MTAELVHGLRQCAARLAELNHAGLQVVQSAFDKAILLLVVRQEIVPERVLCVIS